MRRRRVETSAGERPEQLNNAYVPTAVEEYKATEMLPSKNEMGKHWNRANLLFQQI